MVQVGINLVRQHDCLAKGCREVSRDHFFDLSIDQVHPIIMKVREAREVRLFRSEPDRHMPHLSKIGNHTLGMIHMALAGSDMETGEGHDCHGDI